MTDNNGAAHAVDEKEKRRRKQSNRMGKILAKAWNLKGSEAFQEEKHASSKEGHVLDLSTIGQKIDENKYRLGRHGWEDFARDLGGVYNRHIQRKTKFSKTASNNLKDVKEMLGHIDQSLAELAKDFVPMEVAIGSKKRKASEDLMDTRLGRKKSSSRSSNDKAESGDVDLSLREREEKAMDALAAFVEENGGSREQVAGFRSRVTRKPSDRRYDVNFYNAQGRRFRSMVEVGRFLNLIKERKASFKKKPKTSREKEAEKKKLRKELERLRKAHQRATKALDDFMNDQKESRFPMEDLDLELLGDKKQAITPSTCAAARIPDIRGFDGVPKHCIPDLLMTWDFLCTFHRPLELDPISLDDFASALTYQPPDLGHMKGDDIQAPPVFLGEAHLGLLKLLVQDRQSDEWWWSILETQETEAPDAKFMIVEEKEEDANAAVIKVDMSLLLDEEEDPLITNSWLTSLEEIGKISRGDSEALKKAIKPALAVMANKWVAAYVRKSLKLAKRKDISTSKKAIMWLVERVKEARPDLFNRSVRESRMHEIRKRVLEEATQQMDKLSDTAPVVKEEDLVSDAESDDEDSDDSDDEEMGVSEKGGEDVGEKDESELPSSAIPPRPTPTLVDFLLPPIKPNKNSEFVNAFTWPQMAGAAAWRILHRFKRLRNEVDDSLRAVHELPQLTVAQRREREASATSRVFTECCTTIDDVNPAETAVAHLCSGGDYLDLSPVQRLCILRIMIEAAYDTCKVQDVVDGNIKQRINASKTLDAEERKAKKEAREKEAAAQASAREQLAAEARNKFLEEKRAEIRQINEGSNEFTDEFIESLTDEDIIEFDEDIKADYAALPPPESFSKIEVNKMVARMQEEAAFETHSLRVLTMEQLLEQEEEELKAMEEQLASYGDSPDQYDANMDRETSRSIDRLRRNIEKAKDSASNLPEQRELAILILRDAMQDGTIKVLKSALREAKLAKLCGDDETTGGMWAYDLMRDAALELEKAKQHKRVADARKELVAKRNKCFIRNEPLGRDRYRNRFWHFDKDDHSHFWVEADYVLEESKSEGGVKEAVAGFLDLSADIDSIFIGAKDEEKDLTGENASDQFCKFARQEYHPSGAKACLAKKSWGCHATEKSLRTLIKDLDSRGIREHELKSKMKEALEENAGGEKHDVAKEGSSEAADDNKKIETSGDEDIFRSLKESEREASRDGISMDILDTISSAIDAQVRVRVVVEGAKEPANARYENGKIAGFKSRTETVESDQNGDSDNEFNESAKTIRIDDWQALTDRGNTYWLSNEELTESICRFRRWSSNDKGYFEFDAAFLSYRNSLGRHCGRAAEAPYSASPMVFARSMVRKEQELYAKLKNRNYDNNWGGKSGARAAWSNSMKDYTFDLNSAREGLLTLENAFFELMDGINVDEKPNGKEILENPATRDDIELESLDGKNITGLWNSPESRAVYYEIVQNCKTTGFLALAFDLLCRNTTAYLRAHKLLNVKVEEPTYQKSTRSTRRMNAWQQANQDDDW